MRGGEIAVDLGHLAADRAHPVSQRAGARQRAEIAVLEIGALRLGFLELLLARLELRIEEAERLGRLDAVAGEILLDEHVDQLLDDLARDLGARSGHHDLEQIVLLRGDLDRFLQARDPIGDVGWARDAVGEIGAAHDLFQIDRRGQRLADRVDILLLLGGADPDRVGQDRLHLDEDAGARFVAVRDLRHDQPAERSRSPRRPPSASQRRVQIAWIATLISFVKVVHPLGALLRTCSRG